jgi:predicted phage gp36 major capsid-like protein
MEGEFDDILGQDDPEKKHKEWVEENKTGTPSNKSFKTLNDAYQKSQKRWKMEAEVKEELKERFEEAEKKLIKEKLEFEQEYTVDENLKDRFDNGIQRHKESMKRNIDKIKKLWDIKE